MNDRHRREAQRRARAQARIAAAGPTPRRAPDTAGSFRPDPIMFARAKFTEGTGDGWSVELTAAGVGLPHTGPTLPAPDTRERWTATDADLPRLYERLHDTVDRIADEIGMEVGTVHSLDGDVVSWLELVDELGLDVTGDGKRLAAVVRDD